MIIIKKLFHQSNPYRLTLNIIKNLKTHQTIQFILKWKLQK